MLNSPFANLGIAGRSSASALDPGVKLLTVLVVMVLLSTSLSVYPFLVLTIAIIAGLVLLRVSAVSIRSLIAPGMTMLAVTFLMHLLFAHKQGTPLLTVVGLTITREALIQGLMFCWRVALFLLTALCFMYMITPDQFAVAIWRGLAPFRRLGLPVDDIGLSMFLGIRFIPEIFRQYHQIRLAQQARGAKIVGGLINRTRRIIPLLVPVTAAALRRSGTLGDCLLIRGWGASERRTYFGRSRLGAVDVVLLLFLAILVVVVVLL